MGHRASYAIKERGTLRFAADRWAATRIPQQVADGQDGLVAGFAAASAEADGLMGEVWCEGAAGMDVDERRLVFFGGDDIVTHAGLRDAVVGLIRRSWPGWDVRWAHNGVVDVADAFGLDRRALEEIRPPLVPDLDHLAPAVTPNTLVTLCDPGGARHVWLELPLGSLEALLAGGPEILGTLGACATQPLGHERDVHNGVVIDRAAGRLTYWYSLPERDRCDELAAYWPGWHVERITGGFREHLARAGLDGSGRWLARDDVAPHAPAIDDTARLDAWLEGFPP